MTSSLPFSTDTNEFITPSLALNLTHAITFAAQQSSENAAQGFLDIKYLRISDN